MKTVFTLLLLVTGAALARGQIVLDDFNAVTGATNHGTVIGGTSWTIAPTASPTVTQNASSITVAAKDENGWGAQNLTPFNVTGLNFIAITARPDAGNTASVIVVELRDSTVNSNPATFSVSMSLFTPGSFTTVYVPTNSWTSGSGSNASFSYVIDSAFDKTSVSEWSIGGGSGTPVVGFNVSFDHLALTASAIPEPSTYAALGGACALLAAVWRRKTRPIV